MYLNIKNLPKPRKMSREEQIEYLRRAKVDKKAMDEFVLLNIHLVHFSIHTMFKNKDNFNGFCRQYGLEYDDFFNDGVIGLIKAIKNFDENFGTTFSTYAIPMIRGEIQRNLRDRYCSTVRLPRTVYELLSIYSYYVNAKEMTSDEALSEIRRMIGKKLSKKSGPAITEKHYYDLVNYVNMSLVFLDEGLPNTKGEKEITNKHEGLVASEILQLNLSYEDEVEFRIFFSEFIDDVYMYLEKEHLEIAKIKYYDINTSISQAELGKRIGLSQPDVSRKEKFLMDMFELYMGISNILFEGGILMTKRMKYDRHIEFIVKHCTESGEFPEYDELNSLLVTNQLEVLDGRKYDYVRRKVGEYFERENMQDKIKNLPVRRKIRKTNSSNFGDYKIASDTGINVISENDDKTNENKEFYSDDSICVVNKKNIDRDEVMDIMKFFLSYIRCNNVERVDLEIKVKKAK